MLGRRIPFNQIAFATLVGVVGGVYIYRPMFEPLRKPAAEELKPDPEEMRTAGQHQDTGAPETQTHRD
ncbi:protein PIGBOS1 [Danio rerio]|uniref:PIGB opposite strand 1 n=1 Tax=Danio rerio TaxID=7955 RepID=A0A2R8QR33_DANRE|nr:protein PIGBOS1 [Danio rerio]|eukprot:NP_001295368.1 protein PIGBOS1 [Danio rerio]